MAVTGVRARDVLDTATNVLGEAGCDTPRLDAELLVADALAVDRTAVIVNPEMEVTAAAVPVIAERIRRRAQREPVAYILGRRGFRRIELAVDRRVLIPRPETELLVEVALELPEAAAVHEVGTGCGAVALALKHERRDLRVSASDVAEHAIEVARANAARLGLDVELAVADGLPPGRYDLILANLPYVREREWPALAPEITRWEPRDALAAGADGLAAIRALVGAAPPRTRLALEHGFDQAADVRALLADAHTRRDLAGHERVTVGARP